MCALYKVHCKAVCYVSPLQYNNVDFLIFFLVVFCRCHFALDVTLLLYFIFTDTIFLLAIMDVIYAAFYLCSMCSLSAVQHSQREEKRHKSNVENEKENEWKVCVSVRRRERDIYRKKYVFIYACAYVSLSVYISHGWDSHAFFFVHLIFIN